MNLTINYWKLLVIFFSIKMTNHKAFSIIKKNKISFILNTIGSVTSKKHNFLDLIFGNEEILVHILQHMSRHRQN